MNMIMNGIVLNKKTQINNTFGITASSGNTHTSFYCSDGINGQYKICFYSSGNIGIGDN